MKKKLVGLGLVVGALVVTSVGSFAASDYKTPAEAVAGLTGKTVESIVQERVETGKTYGTIANDAGKLEEFKAENLKIKEDNLNAQVQAGTRTQESADAILERLKANQAVCDGTGSAGIGQGMGAGFGSNGTGNGAGNGAGTGSQDGTGTGQNLQDGSGNPTGGGQGMMGSGKGQGSGGQGGGGVGGMGLRDGSCY